jgi:hypothetical protein
MTGELPELVIRTPGVFYDSACARIVVSITVTLEVCVEMKRTETASSASGLILNPDDAAR